MNALKRNRFFFGLGTVGRDMFYTTVSMFLMVYLTEVLNLSNQILAWTGTVLTVMRIFDALNDPIMGVIVDNTNTRWGKFKPHVLVGGLLGSVFMVLMFTDLGLSPVAYVVCFALFYLGWDITYGLNDIGYWSMLPALSLEQKEREKIGSVAKICANVGMFTVVVGIVPLTNMLGQALGGKPDAADWLNYLKPAWTVFAVIVSVLMLGFLMFTLFGAKEMRGEFKQEENTSIKDMVRAIFKNDQLLFTTISMGLFMIGYCTTTSFGFYYFKYAFGDAGMYSIFAAVLGVSQLSALAVFPMFSKRFTRKQLYFGATVLVLAGYVLFFFSPMNMVFIGISGMLLFVGEAFIQLLMLMFLADTIEYGQWKSGKRNQSVTFSLQPLINKIGGAISTGIVTATLIVSGINNATSAADVPASGVTILKLAMFVLPLISIVCGYLVYRWKYKIDKGFYDKMIGDLTARGDIKRGDGT
jgi:sugar (glycoside-pentoside-hexuronide) transporter